MAIDGGDIVLSIGFDQTALDKEYKKLEQELKMVERQYADINKTADEWLAKTQEQERTLKSYLRQQERLAKGQKLQFGEERYDDAAMKSLAESYTLGREKFDEVTLGAEKLESRINGIRARMLEIQMQPISEPFDAAAIAADQTEQQVAEVPEAIRQMSAEYEALAEHMQYLLELRRELAALDAADPDIGIGKEIDKTEAEIEQVAQRMSDLKQSIENPQTTGGGEGVSGETFLKSVTTDAGNAEKAITTMIGVVVPGFEQWWQLGKRVLSILPGGSKIVGEIEKAFAKLTPKVKETSKEVNRAGQGFERFSNRIKLLARNVFVFNIVNKGLRAMRDVLGTAIMQNEEFAHSLAQIKGNLYTAFAPVWQALLPAINALGRALAWVTGLLAKFISLLFGKSIKASQSAASALNAQAGGYGAVSDAAKEAEKSLASFDEINTLTTAKDVDISGGGGGGGGVTDDGPLFDFDYSQLTGLEKVLNRILEPLQKIDFGPLIASLSKLWDAIKTTFGKIGEVLLRFYEVALAPLITIIIEDIAPVAIEVIAEAVELVGNVIETAWPYLEQFYKDWLEPLIHWAAEKVVDFLEKVRDLLAWLNDNPDVVDLLVRIALAILLIKAIKWVADLAKGVTVLDLLKGALLAIVLNLPKIYNWIKNIVGVVKEATDRIREWLGENNKLGLSFGQIKKGSEDAATSYKNNYSGLSTWTRTAVTEPTSLAYSELFSGIGLDSFNTLLGTEEDWGGLLGFMTEEVTDPTSAVFDTAFGQIGDKSGETNTRIRQELGGLAGWATTDVADPMAKGFTDSFDEVDKGAGGLWTGIATGAIGMVNNIIDAINALIKGILTPFNFMIRQFNRLPNTNIPELSLEVPHIRVPALAQGAVLPPNKPFMAVVGDQRNGTNIEAPLETIEQALRNVMGEQQTVIRFEGSLAQLARVLKPVIDKENNRVGGSLVKGGVA